MDQSAVNDGSDPEPARESDPNDASTNEPSTSGTATGGTATTGEFDWRGWALVAAIVAAFLVVPGMILYLPAAQGVIQSIGLTVRDAYLFLPLIPAFGLGVIAVWSAVRSRTD